MALAPTIKLNNGIEIPVVGLGTFTMSFSYRAIGADEKDSCAFMLQVPGNRSRRKSRLL